MKTNLHLSLDKNIKEQAKAYANEYETSVSAVVEALLEEIVKENKRRKSERKRLREKGSYWTAELFGVIPPHVTMVYSNYSDKELIREALREKYSEYYEDEEPESDDR